eukprot:CAMPEP_0118903354 /NCGR_PEP_ID=MMETSP1166-20130328/8257_1 /TAXON_ID=1104430 /ORGANISM="Chrysoreinhardia sp, Strain CCMP3193" /LENGTH=372 /DNA_ID=CAMNT_0006842581 /DNA_START=6 /DNA_END=1124 /DNA_ORIENTATION=+
MSVQLQKALQLLLLLLAPLASPFVVAPKGGSRVPSSLCAIGVLARKAKEAAAKRRREEVLSSEGDSAIAEVLRKAEEGTLKREAPREIFEKLKQTKALQVITEYQKTSTSSALRAAKVEDYEIPPLSIVSAECRRAGAAAFALNMGTGGCLEEDVRSAVQEQSTARGDYPGPLPVIWNDVVVDEIQLAEAVASEAGAVTLHLDALGLSKLAALLEKARRIYGLETFVSVAKEDDLIDRLRPVLDLGGPQILLLTGFTKEDVDLAAGVVRDSSSSDVAIVVKVDAEDNQGLDEAELAWQLRDAGVDAVWVGDVLFKFGSFAGSGSLYASNPSSITSVVKAMRSKASAAFARASGASFSGKGEGAKEYLGDLLM